MITSFEVGSIFKIVDQATPVLSRLLRGVTQLNDVVKATRTNMGALGAVRVTGATTSVRALTNQTLKLDGAVKAVGDRLVTVTAETRTLAGEWRALAAYATEAAAAMRAAGSVPVSRPSRAAAANVVAAAASAAQRPALSMPATVPAIGQYIAPAPWGYQLPPPPSTVGPTGPRIAPPVNPWAGVAATPPPIGPTGPRIPAGALPPGPPPAPPATPRTPPGGRHPPRVPGLHVSGISGRIPGGHVYFRGGNNAAMAGAGALAYGIYQEGEIEDIVARALITGQVRLDKDMREMDAFRELRDIIQRGAALGGFQPKEVAHAILTTERQFGGLAFDERMKVLRTLLPAAMTEAKMKDAQLPEAFEALVGLAHMTGTFDPKQLPEIVRGFTYASTITPVPIAQFQRALSYSMPILHAGLDMDPNAIMFLTAMTQTAGVTNTKSGTWIRSFFERLMPSTGISLMRDKGKHNAALRAMGLLDENDKPAWQIKDAGGKVDWMASTIELAKRLQVALAAMPNEERLGKLSQVFGERGGGFGALMNLPQFVEQLPIIAGKMKSFVGGEDLLGELARVSPVQQARNAWADMTNVLMDIAQVALPPLTSALKGFDDLLKSMKDHFPTQGNFAGLPERGSLGEALGKGMGPGAIGGAIIGLPFGNPWVGAAAGALIGGIYTGGRYLLGIDDDKLLVPPAKNPSVGGDGEPVLPLRPQKQSWNAVPPPDRITIEPTKVTLNVDGRVLGEVQVTYMAREGNRPIEGSPYFDATHSPLPVDFALG